MIQVVLGCNKVMNDGHIDQNLGIFGILDEKIKKVNTGLIIPSKENTSCKCRRTPKCSIKCKNSVYGIRVGYKISYMQNKRM